MKKVEWLLAVLLIAMGISCMTVSAVSFRSPFILSSGIIQWGICFLFIGLLSFALIRIYKARKKY